MFWDVVLAVALAVLSLVSIGWDRDADQQAPRSDVDIVLDPSPDGLAAGEPWDVEITVREADPSLWNVTPRSMITNTGTGESTTFDAEQTATPGVYRVRVVFPVEGSYAYEVLPYNAIITIPATGGARPSQPVVDDGDSQPFPMGEMTLALVGTLPIAYAPSGSSRRAGRHFGRVAGRGRRLRVLAVRGAARRGRTASPPTGDVPCRCMPGPRRRWH